jgi:hypothetical protein
MSHYVAINSLILPALAGSRLCLSVIGASQAGTCTPMRASGKLAQYFMGCSPQLLYMILILLSQKCHCISKKKYDVNYFPGIQGNFLEMTILFPLAFQCTWLVVWQFSAPFASKQSSSIKALCSLEMAKFGVAL